MRASFVASEVGNGLRRNLTMTVALVITIAVSLALFGASLLVRSQVATMKDFWYDKVQVSIFLCGKLSDAPSCSGGPVTEAQRAQIKTDLESLKPLVEQVYYESKDEAYARFKEQFAKSPIVDTVTKDALPESFRVKLSDPTQYDVVASAFAGRPGIEQVNDQRQVLDRFFRLLGGLQAVALIIAIVMIIVTVLLVVNTMRVAAFSRRRETGIMRLVGASNLSIQLPFLLEAVVASLAGAVLASIGLIAAKATIIDGVLAPSLQFTTFIGWDAVIAVIPILVLVGVLLSGLAAFFTLRKYLRV